MLIRFLEKLREKPESYRKKFALALSLGCTAIIFFVWLGAVTSTFSTKNFVGETKTLVTPIQSLTGDVASVGAALKESFNIFKPQIYEAPAEDEEETPADTSSPEAEEETNTADTDAYISE